VRTIQKKSAFFNFALSSEVSSTKGQSYMKAAKPPILLQKERPARLKIANPLHKTREGHPYSRPARTATLQRCNSFRPLALGLSQGIAEHFLCSDV
jgi:hypothetical protein